MKSMLEYYKDDLKKADCDWCMSEDRLYKLHGDLLCEECLRTTEAEEAERGLSLEERNK